MDTRKGGKKADKMNSKFKELIKPTGNNRLTNYIRTSYNEPQTFTLQIRNTKSSFPRKRESKYSITVLICVNPCPKSRVNLHLKPESVTLS